MTVQEVAKRVMRDAGLTQADVAKKCGVGQSSIGMFLKSKSMRVDSLLMILDACGYELAVRNPGNRRAQEYVINGKEGEDDPAAGKEMQDTIRAIVAEELAKMAKKK